MAHLIDEGYRKIFHFAGPEKLDITKDRMNGYIEAMQDANLPISDSTIIHSGIFIRDGEQTMEDYAKEKFNEYYDKDSDSAMLVIDISDGNSFICTSGNMKYLSDSQEDIQKAVRSCIKESDGKKTLDCMSAVDKLLTFIQ